MMKLALPGTVEKTRYYVPYKGHIWEVDVFHGKNEGLVVAEIEFKNGEVPFEKPPWLGEEVTFNPCYKNSSLSEHPYSEWKKDTPAKAACLKP
jgi:CYTH domain-containing protein